MRIERLDHLVLTVADVEATVDFYGRVLGMTPVTFGAGRRALTFGEQKINLHQAGAEFEPKAHRATPGSADLCFVISTDLDDVERHLREVGVDIEEGPVDRTGALGPIRSIYFRDPDLNLIEVSVYSALAAPEQRRPPEARRTRSGSLGPLSVIDFRRALRCRAGLPRPWISG